jgi:diacylglycerol kinase
MKGYSLGQSIKAAVRGVKYAFVHERNFRVEIYIAIMVIIALFVLGASLMQAAIVVMMIFLVLMIELMNTVIERVVDIFKPRNHPYAGVIKDISAAMVLVLSVGASIVGLIIFVPLMIAALT